MSQIFNLGLLFSFYVEKKRETFSKNCKHNFEVTLNIN